MKHTITLEGKIVFDPKDYTAKHKSQSSWKRVAMVVISGDVSEYYAWYLKKRYNLILNSPLRGAHISFINDHIRDLNGGKGSEKERQVIWEALKKKYHGTKITITLSTDMRTDGTNWWLVMPESERGFLHGLRSSIGLSRPYWGLHMSIGYAVDGRGDEDVEGNGLKAGRMDLTHSNYIHTLLKKGLCN